MKIVVIGGTGQVGTRLVAHLGEAGHEAVAASPSTGVDTLTGEGLDAALAGAQVVVDVTGSPTWEDDAILRFFRDGSRHLLAAEARAGVGHHVALSIVGIDRAETPAGYFRAKLAQEDVVRDGTIPYTIARATQFFEFLGQLAEISGYVLPPAPMQPIAVDDVARLLAAIAVDEPANGIVELAGPERAPLDALARRVVGDAHEVVTDPDATYAGTPWTDDLLVPGDGARIAPTTLEQWLREPAHDRA